MRNWRLSPSGRASYARTLARPKEVHVEKRRETARKYRERNRERIRAYHRSYQKMYRQLSSEDFKLKARNKTYRAVRDGKLIKLSCEVCGNPESQAHHHDYNKPFSVVWLCAIHHAELHQGISTE